MIDLDHHIKSINIVYYAYYYDYLYDLWFSDYEFEFTCDKYECGADCEWNIILFGTMCCNIFGKRDRVDVEIHR